jgi:hypothetical protein
VKFGKSYEDVVNEPASAGGENSWMKYLGDEDVTFQILQEPNEWQAYWEHYNPGGYPFPCTGERETCPGCTSSNEKMKKASRKVAFNVLEGDYVNVYKVPKSAVADKLANRAERIGTILDREYTISRIVTKNKDGSKNYDYDIEGGEKRQVDPSKFELKDIESMLAKAYDQSWGDGAKAKETEAGAEYGKASGALKEKLDKAKAEEEPPPFEDHSKDAPSKTSETTTTPTGGSGTDEYEEADLRAMEYGELLVVLEKEGVMPPDDPNQDVDALVDWLLDQ